MPERYFADGTVRFIRFIQRHTAALIVLCSLLTALLAFFAFRIRVIPDVYALLPQEETSPVGVAAQPPEPTEALVLAVDSASPYELDKLRLLAEVAAEISALPGVRSSVTPFSMLAFEGDGRRVMPRTIGPRGGAPSTEEELERFRERLASDLLARGMVVSEDGQTLFCFFALRVVEDYSGILAEVRDLAKRLEPSWSVHVAGSPPLIEASQRYLRRDVPRLLVGAIVVVLVVFFLGFGSKRSVLLPFMVIALAALWTTGVMSVLGFSLSLVSLMVPPLVLILGSSYSIHVITQYYRDVLPELGREETVVRSVGRITPTVFLASGTTVFGFLGLLTAEIRQVREFGISAAVGIALAALLALVLLPAILTRLRPPRPEAAERVESGWAARLLAAAGSGIVRFRLAFLAALVAICAGFGLTAHSIRYATDYISFFRAKEPAVEHSRFVIRKLGGYINVNLSVSAPGGKSGYFLDPKVLKTIAVLEDRLLESPDVSYITSFTRYLRAYALAMTGSDEVPDSRPAVIGFSRLYRGAMSTEFARDYAGSLANEDFSVLTLAVRAYDSRRNNLMYEDRLEELAAEMRSVALEVVGEELQPVVWGSSMSAVKISQQLARDQVTSSLIAGLLILTLVSVALRSLKYGLFAVVPTAAGVLLSFLLMVLFSIPLDMVTIMFSCVALGVGVDNSIHIIIQYRRRREAGTQPSRVIPETLRIAGRPIFHTTVSVVAGMLVLTLSGFVPIANFGILVSLAMICTSTTSLTLLPAILATEMAWDARRARRASTAG